MPRPVQALAATVLAAALLAAAPASAQRATASPSSTQRAATASPRPAAARTPVAVPLPPPPEPKVTAAPQAERDWRVGGLIGLSTPRGNGGDASLLLQADVAKAWRTTPGGVALSWALPVRTVFLQSDDASGTKSGGMSVEVTPALRASVPVSPGSTLALRTDVGAGVVARSTWTETDVTYIGRQTTTDQGFSAVVRVAFALDWTLKPGVILAFEPLSFGFDLDGNADWNFAAGLAFRL